MTMKKFLKVDEWNIIEEGFHADNLRASESIFSLGNGRFGQRGNFEESYSSDSLQGSYVAGITFLDRTRVGWWKNGYPRFFSRIPNTPDWSGIYVRLIDEELDLAHWDVESYERRLDMKAGISYRDFRVTSPKGKTPVAPWHLSETYCLSCPKAIRWQLYRPRTGMEGIVSSFSEFVLVYFFW